MNTAYLKTGILLIIWLTVGCSALMAQNHIFLKNLATERYALSSGTVIKGNASGSWTNSPEVVGADANYYNLAKWELIPVKGEDHFIIRNVKTRRYLMCSGEPIRKADAQDGGWSKSKAILASDGNYYGRARWKFTKTRTKKGKAGYLLTNYKTNRLLFSTGEKPTKSEGGWTKSPKLVGADANYYHRAVWFITGEGEKLLTNDKLVSLDNGKNDLLLSNFKQSHLSTKHWYHIAAKGLNKVVDIAGSGKADKTNIGLYGKHANQNYTNQHFKFVSKGNGTYEIRTRLNPNSLIDDSSKKGLGGANAYLSASKGLQSQRFKLLQDKDGYVYFKSLVQRDSYLGWKRKGGSYNLEIVKYTGKGSEKSMQFELKQWRQISTSNIPLHIVSDFATQKANGGNVVKYDVKEIEYVSMKTSKGTTMGKVKLNFEPEAAWSNGFLYSYLKLNGAKIEMKNYSSQTKKKGFYLKDLVITITSKDLPDLKLDNPENLNSKGQYTESESFSIGANANTDGAGVNGDYTWGSSFSRSVMDFKFENETNEKVAQFSWKLGKSNNGVYENYRSLGVKSASQYTSIAELPAMSKNNFPIDCEVVYRKYMTKRSIPNKVTLNMNIKATFEKTWLWNDDANGVESFFNGFGALVNPKSYSGELLYKFEHVEETTENNIEVQLDLSKLK